ncbi:RNA polymerase I-specific transcription initiation factor RRN3 [Ceraceosorus guamensis]|uniref:RNA polymerase I-specific transcription initiation factor RRN3 n=1 Tax=Ceraceosorus guamensis TaxID=1522189 RepID=A0A316VWL2_9BASI|nr:RNA polymerase I-specific transcription initiation factor RRN3 [Ceraceosorus guamensis]PWN40701.1 RNA polymerase I-specific transcription initiation factor RRN3 [Ceraceosorus guamensis]
MSHYRKGMYISYVTNSFSELSKGNAGPYQDLIGQFKAGANSLANPGSNISKSATSISALSSWLSAVSAFASHLDRRTHNDLVESILALPWTTTPSQAFAASWIRFVCALVSARSEWTKAVLKKAMQGFGLRSEWRPPTNPTQPLPPRKHTYYHIHLLLRSLLSLIPTLPSQLAPLLVRSFPHKREGKVAHLVFVSNALKLCEYAPELAETVLSCVVDRGMQIDVEIQLELDDLEDDVDPNEAFTAPNAYDDDPFRSVMEGTATDDDDDSDDEDGLLLEDDGFSDLSGSDGEDSRLDDAAAQAKRLKTVRELVDKLDAVMGCVFRHLEDRNSHYEDLARGGDGSVSRMQLDERKSAAGELAGISADLGLDLTSHAPSPARAAALRSNQFHLLLSVFQRAVLPTFKSRYVQFFVFWAASLDPDFADLLLGFLLGKAIYGVGAEQQLLSNGSTQPMTGSEPTIMRVAASSYVASLVSRARYISISDTRAVMLNLCSFLEGHLERTGRVQVQEASEVPSGARRQLEAELSGGVNGQHALFYSVAQAAFYIFCFRWRDLRVSSASEDEESAGGQDLSTIGNASWRWSEGLHILQRAITSPLNPLAHCSPEIVRQFAAVAQHTGLLFCWSIIESNNRRRGKRRAPGMELRDAGSGSGTPMNQSAPGTPTGSRPDQLSRQASGADVAQDDSDGGGTPRQGMGGYAPQTLDVFFPFDPYRLKHSSRWIDPLYREWSDVAPEGMEPDQEEGEAESGTEAENEADEDQSSLAQSLDPEQGALPASFTTSRSADTTHSQSSASDSPSVEEGDTGNESSVQLLNTPQDFLGPSATLDIPRQGKTQGATEDSEGFSRSLEVMSISR